MMAAQSTLVPCDARPDIRKTGPSHPNCSTTRSHSPSTSSSGSKSILLSTNQRSPEAIGYEAYGEYDVFPNSQEALLPVKGTISRGHSLYEYENSNEGYAAALSELKISI